MAHACLWACLVSIPGWARAGDIPDTLEQRLASCTMCHGRNGEGLKAGEYYPRITGKPAGYLYNQLINFRQHLGRQAVPSAPRGPERVG